MMLLSLSRLAEDVGLLRRLQGALNSPGSHGTILDCTWGHSHAHSLPFTPGGIKYTTFALSLLSGKTA